MSVGDIIRIIAVFNNVGGDKAVNVFTFLVTAIGTGVLTDLLDDIENWLDNFYGEIQGAVAPEITSESFSVLQRDDTLGQWNSLGERTWTTFIGTSIDDSSVDGSAPHIIGYPGQPRYRGSKFLLPLADSQIVDGRLAVGMAGPMGAILARYITPLVEVNLGANPGVYNEASETFRGFAGVGTFSFIPAYQRRRKPGVGI